MFHITCLSPNGKEVFICEEVVSFASHERLFWFKTKGDIDRGEFNKWVIRVGQGEYTVLPNSIVIGLMK